MNFKLALLTLAIEAGVGYPDALFARVGHPVAWFGALIDWLDRRFNRDDDAFAIRRAKGVSALFILLAMALAAGALIERIALALPFGWIALAILASSLMAQRSLHDHVSEVARALAVSLDEGRRAASGSRQAATRAGMRFKRSSQRAAAQPKARCRSDLCPIMLSAVLTTL